MSGRGLFKNIKKREDRKERDRIRDNQERESLENEFKDNIKVRFLKPSVDDLDTYFVVELRLINPLSARALKDILVAKLGDMFG